MHRYTTSNVDKALALVKALIAADFEVGMLHHQGHTHIETTADSIQFGLIRNSIGFPSSNGEPMPESITIPDHLPENFS